MKFYWTLFIDVLNVLNNKVTEIARLLSSSHAEQYLLYKYKNKFLNV